MFSFSDLVYYSSLLICISLGSYYKKIDDLDMKRSYGAGLGILITLMICGHYILHSVLMVWGNIVIIKCCDKRLYVDFCIVYDAQQSVEFCIVAKKIVDPLRRRFPNTSVIVRRAYNLVYIIMYLHYLSLAYTWLYLIYMNYNLDTTHYVFWIHQAIALRLVGLAFELCTWEKSKRLPLSGKGSSHLHNVSHKLQKLLDSSSNEHHQGENANISSSPKPVNELKTHKDSPPIIEHNTNKVPPSNEHQTSKVSTSTRDHQTAKGSSSPDRQSIKSPSQHDDGKINTLYEHHTSKASSHSKHRSGKSSAKKHDYGDVTSAPTEPNAVDIIAYAYYFIGLHKGPYYRWKIFNEHFKTPFGVLGDCRIITEQKLKKAFVCALVYMLLIMKFPVQIYYESEFYASYGTDFRYLYNIPQMLIYVLQYQVVMMLCTSVCTEAGFGVYPTKTQPLPGHGPSTRFSLLNLATLTEEVALEQEYNFAMLRSFENEKLLIGPRMRDTLRGWDMSTRYWFWAHTYKGLIKSNTVLRSALSFIAWTAWCGLTMQQLIISVTLWVHLHLENEYGELYVTNVAMKMPWDIGFSIMRLFCLIYLTPCLILTDTSVVIRYYNSIFWVYHMLLLFLILGAVSFSKERTRRVSESE